MSIYELYKSKSVDQYLFIIVDTIRIKDKLEKLVEFNYENIFDKTNESGTPDEYSPLIFEINFDNCKNEIINEIWSQSDVFSLIFTRIDKSKILKKLRNLLYVEDESRNRFLYRWFDSRILMNIKYLLKKEDLEEILFEVDKWYLKKIDLIKDCYINVELIEGIYGL